ncbi:MAG: hypothetical protein L6Q76_04965, partial [Polyangiaceae bacterium]|nr:hypothetical protein [Polyangiaceae bacterium]
MRRVVASHDIGPTKEVSNKSVETENRRRGKGAAFAPSRPKRAAQTLNVPAGSSPKQIPISRAVTIVS